VAVFFEYIYLGC